MISPHEREPSPGRILRVMPGVAGLVALGLVLASGLLGPPGCAITPLSPTESLRRSKCGACHLPPKPGRFSGAALGKILGNHQRRVPLTEEQRGQLIQHLSSDGGAPTAPRKITVQN